MVSQPRVRGRATSREILGVDEDADAMEIKKAFRKQVGGCTESVANVGVCITCCIRLKHTGCLLKC